MGDVLLADSARAGRIEILDSGSIRVKARIARDGIQVYAPWKGAPIQDRMIRMYRPTEEVFADSSLATLPSTPVTVGHPIGNVNKKNWKKLAVGTLEQSTARVTHDGQDFVEASLVVHEEQTIDSLEARDLVDVSQGYNAELDWTPGTSPDGAPYDVVARNIRHNHTALLGAGKARAGEGAQVLFDSNEEPDTPIEENMADEKQDLEKIREDIRAELKAEAEEKRLADEKEAAEAEEKRLADEKEADSGKEAEAKAFADAQEAIERKLVDLQDTKESASRMLGKDFDFTGKSAREIKLAAIGEHLPDVKFADSATDAEISGTFRALQALETKFVSKAKPNTSLKDHADSIQAAYAKKVDLFDAGE